MIFLPKGSPSCHLHSSKPSTPGCCHSSGVALVLDLPAVKPTQYQHHRQCLKWRTCSLLLDTSTATSNQHNKAKIPGRDACRDVTCISLFSEHAETGCISSPFTNLWSPQIPLDFSLTFCLFVLSALWAALTTHMEGIQPNSSYSLRAGTQDGEGAVTWHEVTGKEAGSQGLENHHACVFGFHPAQ